MKKSGKDRLKQAINESTLSTATADAVPLPRVGKADDARETCCQEIFGHRTIYICGEAATTTLNPEPQNLVKQNPLTRAFFSCIIASVVVMNYVY